MYFLIFSLTVIRASDLIEERRNNLISGYMRKITAGKVKFVIIDPLPFLLFPASVLAGKFNQSKRKLVRFFGVKKVGPSVYAKWFIGLFK